MVVLLVPSGRCSNLTNGIIPSLQGGAAPPLVYSLHGLLGLEQAWTEARQYRWEKDPFYVVTHTRGHKRVNMGMRSSQALIMTI